MSIDLPEAAYTIGFEQLAEAVPHIVFAALPDGTPAYLNRRWYEYTGAKPGENTYETWRVCLHPDDLSRAMEAWAGSLKSGEPFEVEYRLRGSDGQYRWFLALGTPHRGPDGAIAHWFGTATDIDRQKREEEKQRFLARFAGETRALAAPEEVLATVMRLLGEYLCASRSTYNEVDEEHDQVTVHRDYCREGASLIGKCKLSAFGLELLEGLRAGRTTLIDDTSSDPRTASSFDTVYGAIGVRSFIAAPIIKNGRLVAILSVNMLAPRGWTRAEADLVEDVAERTWLAVENARLYEALQREAEERNRSEDLRNRLAAIVESSRDAIVSKDLNGIVTSWNAAAEQIYGYTAAEIMGKSKTLVVPEDRPDELQTILTRIQRGERITPFDTVRRRKDGALFPVSISVSPIIDASGRITGASTIARDITERVRADEERARLMQEIANQRSRLDGLVRSVPGVVWEAWGEPDTTNQRINFVSEYVEAMLGYTVQEWLETPNFWLTIVHQDDREKAGRVAAQAWESGGSKHTNEFRWVCKSGEALWCEAHSVVIRDAEGKPLGMRGVTLDVSERKRAEEERARHLAEVEMLYEQLQRAMLETHHRVRNSLQIIAALVDIEAPASGAMVAADKFRRIGGHVRALAAVHQLLTEQAKRDNVAITISAREILTTLVDLVRQTAGNQCIIANIEDVSLSAQQGSSLAVVAHELMTNALKYGRDAIEIRFLVHDDTATLEISDNGPGFDKSFNPAEAGKTGLELVSQVARWDLRAREMRFDTRSEGGGRVTVTIPLAPHNPSKPLSAD